MKVRESWVKCREALASNGGGDVSLEAEVLIRHATKMDRAQFFAALNEPIRAKSEELINYLLRRRLNREPLAYILRRREFYGLDFHVSPAVLIPRQETEFLVDGVLEYARSNPGRDPVIVDVGTGSGVIAVTLAYHLPRATICATDLSHEALLVADVNRRRHGVSKRVRLVQCDLLEGLVKPVDVVVSNPPYLRRAEIDGLSREVRQEPRRALDGGPDGLDIVSRLVRQATSLLRPGGRLLVEIAPEQLESVCHAGRAAFPGARVTFSRDLMGKPRVVSVGLPEAIQEPLAHTRATRFRRSATNMDLTSPLQLAGIDRI